MLGVDSWRSRNKVFYMIRYSSLVYIAKKCDFFLLSFKLSSNLFIVLQTFKISGWYTVVHQQGRIIIYCEEKRRTRPATWKLTVSPFNSLVMIFISVPITVIIISSDIWQLCHISVNLMSNVTFLFCALFHNLSYAKKVTDRIYPTFSGDLPILEHGERTWD